MMAGALHGLNAKLLLVIGNHLILRDHPLDQDAGLSIGRPVPRSTKYSIFFLVDGSGLILEGIYLVGVAPDHKGGIVVNTNA